MEIIASDSSGARAGVFCTRSGKTIATPALILPADNGTIPHLVATTISLINPDEGYGAYYTALETYLPMIADGTFRADSLASYLHPTCSPLRDAISVCGLRRASPARHYRNSKQAVAAQLNNGSVYRVTPDEYAAAAERFRPDILVPIMDLEQLADLVFDASGGDIPETYLKRRSRRNLTYLKTMLARLSQPELFSVFGLVDGNVDDLLVMDTRLDGYVLPLTEHPDAGHLVAKLPQDKARLAISVSSFEQMVECLRMGMDLFESSWIINMSNKGMAFDYQSGSWLSLKNDGFIEDLSPLSHNCSCYACHEGRHTRAYIRHLFVIDDLLAYVFTTVHNLHQLDAFFAGARKAIRNGELDTFLARMSDGLPGSALNVQ